jgi:hypothetical protein
MFSQTSEAQTTERLRAQVRTTGANSAADRGGRARIRLVASNDSSNFGLGPAPGEDGCHQPGKHAVSWLVGGFASVAVPGFVGMLAGLL